MELTQEEIKVLKEIAQEKIRFHRIFCCDEDGKEYPYRNRYSIDPPHLCADENGELCDKCKKSAESEPTIKEDMKQEIDKGYDVSSKESVT